MTLSRSWVVRPIPIDAPRLRLICFPHAGGGAVAYRDWSKEFPDRMIEVCALQFPGRAARMLEPPPLSINQIVEAITDEFFTYYAESPTALFGHSFGALVAFEVARRVSALNFDLVHLFVSGQVAPQLPDREPPIRNLSDEEFISEMSRRYDGIPAEILREREMMQLLLPVLRADMTVKETYQYLNGPLLKCPISAFGGRNDSSATIEELEGWREQTSGAFKLRMFSGGHFFIHNERRDFLRTVAEDLEHSLRAASSTYTR